MRTCRQIYHEAADYLYSRGRVGIEVDGDSLRMLGQSFKPAVEAMPCPGVFTYVRRLDFRIMLKLHPGLDLRDVCTMYMTTAHLARLAKQHQLHDVVILLEVNLPAGSISCRKQDLTVHLSKHQTGDITWQHIAAFVMDPLREIQARLGGKVNFDRPLLHPPGLPVACFPAPTRRSQ